MRKALFPAVVLLLSVVVCPAAAQVVAGPSGSTGGLFGGHRPVDPNHTSQRLSLDVDFSQGYDSNLEGSVAGDPTGLAGAGYASTAQAVAKYWRGRSSRFFQFTSRGFANYESELGDKLVGGEAMIQGSSGIGGPLQLAGGTWIDYEPAMVAAPFGPTSDPSLLGGGEFVPQLHPPTGVVQQKWLTAAGYFNVERPWSVRQHTTAEYRVSQRQPIDEQGLESLLQQVSVQHYWNFTPSVRLQSSYRFDDNQQATQSGPQPSLRTSTADGGIRIERRYSPVRSVSVEVAGGVARPTRAAFGETSAVNFLLPVWRGSARAGLTRIWSVSVEGRHDVSVLEGLSPEPFAANEGSLMLDAALSHRLTIATGAAISRGTGIENKGAGFEATSAQGQLQYGIARCCGIFVAYTYYDHKLRDVSSLPDGYPARYNRHAARVGFSWWLPLYGSF